MLKKADYFLIICLSVFALSFLFIFDPSGGSEGDMVVISVEGSVYKTLDINENTSVMIESVGGFNVVEISGRVVKMADADCSDMVCVKHGGISRNNEMIVCLPNRIVVEVKSGEFNEVDAILR